MSESKLEGIAHLTAQLQGAYGEPKTDEQPAPTISISCKDCRGSGSVELNGALIDHHPCRGSGEVFLTTEDVTRLLAYSGKFPEIYARLYPGGALEIAKDYALLLSIANKVGRVRYDSAAVPCWTVGASFGEELIFAMFFACEETLND